MVIPPMLISRLNVIKITADFFAEIDNWQLILKFMEMQERRGSRAAKKSFDDLHMNIESNTIHNRQVVETSHF